MPSADEHSGCDTPQVSLPAARSGVVRPDQVWCADITCVPMPGGHACLCAGMDWHSRLVLGWAVSNTMEVGLCLSALNAALADTGHLPEIFKTDQGCQFSSAECGSKTIADTHFFI